MSWELATAFLGFSVLWLLFEGAMSLDDSEHGIIKLFLFLLSFWYVFLLVHIGLAILTENSVSATVTEPVGMIIRVMATTNTLLTVYFLLYYVQKWVKHMGGKDD